MIGGRTTVLAIACGVVLASCGSPTAPSPSAAIAGTWTGAVNDNVAGRGTLTLTLSRSDTTLSGVWSATYTLNSVMNGSGGVTGTITGTQVSATLTPDQTGRMCLGVAASVASGQLTGTYYASFCQPPGTGVSGGFGLVGPPQAASFTLTRQ